MTQQQQDKKWLMEFVSTLDAEKDGNIIRLLLCFGMQLQQDKMKKGMR